jgi:hypothetical protein
MVLGLVQLAQTRRVHDAYILLFGPKRTLGQTARFHGGHQAPGNVAGDLGREIWAWWRGLTD